jgi:GT2 family glycosyltransferase
MKPALSVIIVNYNTRQMTLNCLQTLKLALAGEGGLAAQTEIIVIDNASTDGSATAIAETHPDVTLISSPINAGFGGANNLGMHASQGRLLLLLNSDAFPKPGSIGAMLRYLEAHPKVGVLGPKLLNADGSLQLSCFRFPSPLQCWAENLWLSSFFPSSRLVGDYRRWGHDTAREVDFVSGAVMLVRREAYEAAGTFDERFFMYAEETDWQKRIRKAGWLIEMTPDAEVVHLGGASGGDEKVRVRASFFESLDYYEYKHHGLPGFVLMRIAMAVGCSMRAVLWCGAWAMKRSRREYAASKVRLHLWLVWRQLTTWNVRALSGANR